MLRQFARPFFDGSSPHTRGARRRRRAKSAATRIIPAYAGSTSPWSAPSSRAPDHPRIRGEHDIGPRHFIGLVGSSPHTRGAQPVPDAGGQRRGIIPAYAGSTISFTTSSSMTPDHPRIRGEHAPPYPPGVPNEGSSPHTRGARRRCRRRRTRGRIIPAYAGSTPSRPSTPCTGKDHPRIRGEHGEYRAETGGGRGIIPAYAGSTPRRTSTACRRPDHPRIRGEHASMANLAAVRRGSSPHTRGAPLGPRPSVLAARIIPAYAGSTPGGSPTP